MADYKMHIIHDDASKVQTRTFRDNPEDYAPTLMAIELQKYHYDTPFQTLVDMVERNASRMGYQMAFCDEQYTLVVTEIRRNTI